MLEQNQHMISWLQVVAIFIILWCIKKKLVLPTLGAVEVDSLNPLKLPACFFPFIFNNQSHYSHYGLYTTELSPKGAYPYGI